MSKQVPIGPSGDVAEVVGEVQETALAEYNAGILDAYPGGREAFALLLADVPEPSEDAAARIVLQILDAQTAEELDRPWDVDGMREYDGVVLRVLSIVKMPSDYTTGLGCYLVCTCSQPEIGEQFVLTTGSVSVVAQLVRAHVAGWLPLDVVPRQSARPTRKGYRPMHLELVRRGRRARAQVIEQAAQPAAAGGQ